MRTFLLLLAPTLVSARFLRAKITQTSTGGDKPVLIITGGPTGAGKSHLQRAAKDAIGAADAEFVYSIVDDLVENDKTYKSAVKEILNGIMPEDASEAVRMQALEEQLSSPTKELSRQFANAYFAARQSGDCGHPELAKKKSGELGGCDEVNDNMLRNAIAEGKNILLETTVGFPGWLFGDEFVGKKYDAYYAASLVDTCELLKRNKNRAFRQATAFLADTENVPAMRLPDVTPQGPYPGLVRMHKQNLHKIIHDVTSHECTGENPRFCANVLKEALIYDNNGKMDLRAAIYRDDISSGGEKTYSEKEVQTFDSIVELASTEPKNVATCLMSTEELLAYTKASA